MDFIVHLPKTKRGYDAIVVFVDRLTKTMHAEPTTTDAPATEIARIFFNTIFRHYGLPTSIISDRDPKFTSHFWMELFKNLETRLALSSSFHPETDGQTERTNRTLEQILRNYVSYEQDDWDSMLVYVEFAYNNAVQSSTGFTPFHLLYGQNPTIPTSLISPKIETNVQATQESLTKMAELIKRAQENIVQAQERQAKYANEHRREHKFNIGDQVLISSNNITPAYQMKKPTRKFQARFLGPYEITEEISPVSYRLDLRNTLRVHPVFHVSKLRPYQESNREKFPERAQAPPQPVEVDGWEEYEVERILDKRIRFGKPNYLVKWKGYPDYDATWEPLANLENARELVDGFEKL
jgi:hypothetical protein